MSRTKGRSSGNQNRSAERNGAFQSRIDTQNAAPAYSAPAQTGSMPPPLHIVGNQPPAGDPYNYQPAAPGLDPSQQHEFAGQPMFEYIESFFDARNADGSPKAAGEYVEFFDDSITKHANLSRQAFSHDEINTLRQALPNKGGVLVKKDLNNLSKARAAYDQASAAKKPLDFMRITKSQRASVQARKDARGEFFEAKNNYLERVKPAENNNLATLTRAREVLAEQTYIARSGDLIGGEPANIDALNAAEEAYWIARDTYLDEMVQKYSGSGTGDSHTLGAEDVAFFATKFNSLEQGKLAGEEANHYLSEINDEDQKSWMQKRTEQYNQLDWKGKLAVGLGGGAIGGAAVFAAGLAGAGIGAGVAATYAVRFARNYFRTNARRHDIEPFADDQEKQAYKGMSKEVRGKMMKDLRDKRETQAQQMRSVTSIDGKTSSAGNWDTFASDWKEATDWTQTDGQDFNNWGDIAYKQSEAQVENHAIAVENERDRETSDKRKALRNAALLTAGGAIVGELVQLSPNLSLSSITDHLPGHHGTPASLHGEVHDQVPQPSIDNPVDPPTAPPEVETPPMPTISPESQSLYGDFAGRNLDIPVVQGSSLWSTLDSNLQRMHPDMTQKMRDHYIANTLEALKQQNPGIQNINKIPPGMYHVKLAA